MKVKIVELTGKTRSTLSKVKCRYNCITALVSSSRSPLSTKRERERKFSFVLHSLHSCMEMTVSRVTLSASVYVRRLKRSLFAVQVTRQQRVSCARGDSEWVVEAFHFPMKACLSFLRENHN